jgi:myo-inositol-1(or 4)-monophosphatase
MQNVNLEEIKNFIIPLIKDAGQILLDNFEKIEIVKWKDKQDVCTNVDIEVETTITNSILKKFPDSHIFTEEQGELGLKSSDFTWIIDPLDGTKHYIRHLPIFNTSIALQYKNELIFGASFWPTYNELYWAGKGMGSHLNDNKKNILSKTDKLENAFLYTDFPNYKLNHEEMTRAFNILHKIVKSCYRVRYFADAHAGLSWVARGAFDGFCNYIPRLHKYWDFAAGFVIAREAGATITDLKGHSIKNLEDLNNGFIVTNGQIHDELIKTISPFV